MINASFRGAGEAREPGIQSNRVRTFVGLWIPGSPLRDAPE